MSLRKLLGGVAFVAAIVASLPRAHALPMTIITDEVTTQATVVTRTNNKGYNVVFWNFELPSTFVGTGTANTVTDLTFRFFENTPQGGDGVLPQNIAIYSGFFTSGKYSTVQGSNLFQPVGNSYSTPVSVSGVTPGDGVSTVQVADTGSGQLDMGTFTPGINQPYGSRDFAIPTTQNPFNGTTGNANGQYSLVIWTESLQNYQWKGGGQLQITIPGVSGIKSSLTPGYLDGSGGGAGVVTEAGELAAVVPEPSAAFVGGLASVAMAAVAMRKRSRTSEVR
jgi:hypothetical protein